MVSRHEPGQTWADSLPQSKVLAPDRYAITKAVCNIYTATEKELVAVRRGIRNEPRDVAIYLLRTACGEPLMRIGHEFGMNRYSSVSSAVDRIKKTLQKDRKLKKRLDQILALAQKSQTKT